MKQSATLVTLSALLFASGVSLTTQAATQNILKVESNIERHMAREKSRALVEFALQVKQNLKTNMELFIGDIAQLNAPNVNLSNSQTRIENLERMAD